MARSTTEKRLIEAWHRINERDENDRLYFEHIYKQLLNTNRWMNDFKPPLGFLPIGGFSVVQNMAECISTRYIFLPCQRGERMNDCYDFFICVFVDNNLYFIKSSPYCFFICLRKQNTATAVITTLYGIIGRMCEATLSKFPLNNAFSSSTA